MSQSNQEEIRKMGFYENQSESHYNKLPKTYSNNGSKHLQKITMPRGKKQNLSKDPGRFGDGIGRMPQQKEENFRSNQTKNRIDENTLKVVEELTEQCLNNCYTKEQAHNIRNQITRISTESERKEMWNRKSEIEKILNTDRPKTVEASTQTPQVEVTYRKSTEELAQLEFGQYTNEECQNHRMYRLPGCSLLTGTLWCRIAAEIVIAATAPMGEEQRKDLEIDMQEKFARITRRMMMEVNNTAVLNQLRRNLEESF